MLTAGTAKRIITPPVGVELSGYAGRPGPSSGVHDDLYAKALVADDGNTRIAILTLDILALSITQANRIRELSAQKSGIRPENIMVTCSHTHSGPAVERLRRCGLCDEKYIEWMMDAASDVVGKAARETESVSLLAAKGRSDLAVNRRTIVNGKVGIDADPNGPADHEIGVLIVKTADRYKAVLYNYGCHNVVLGQDNTLVSADWAGSASSNIEESTRANVLFLQGCGGDINPRIRGGYDIVEEAGSLVASEVIGATVGAQPVNGPIAARSKIIDLPIVPLPSIEELERIAEDSARLVKQEVEGENRKAFVDINEARRLWAVEMADLKRRGDCPITLKVEVQAMRLGDARVVGLPGEPFTGLGTSIKSGISNVYVAGYANGVTGYLPTSEAYNEGGYEVDESHRYYSTGMMVGPQSPDILISTARELLAAI